jgi:UPF0716 family protein affecting phage T7 exclusion
VRGFSGYNKLHMGKLLFLFLLLPFVDLYLLVQLGHAYGSALPVLWVIASAGVGIVCARVEGLRVFREWRTALATNAPPEEGVMSGVLLLLGSALLIAPGVISDVLGLALLVPLVRRAIAAFTLRRIRSAIVNGRLHVVQAQPRTNMYSRFAQETAPPRAVIDVDGETVQRESSESPPRGLKPENQP